MNENDEAFITEEENKLFSEAALIRGTILNAFAMLERMIDVFLVRHFCKDKDLQRELFLCVFASKYMTFENKRMIFDHITKDEKYKEYKEKNITGIYGKLDDFNKHRITMAHYSIDTMPDSFQRFNETKEVLFMSYTKEIKPIPYNMVLAGEIAQSIYDFVPKMTGLLNLTNPD